MPLDMYGERITSFWLTLLCSSRCATVMSDQEVLRLIKTYIVGPHVTMSE